MADITIHREGSERVRVVYNTGKGRDWIAANIKGSPETYTLPRDSVYEVMDIMKEAGLEVDIR